MTTVWWAVKRLLLLLVLIWIGLYLLTGSGLFYVIPAGSMEDTLLIGDRIFALPIFDLSSVERHDVVIFLYPINASQTFIRRVVGVPGDRIRITNKQLFVSGDALDEPYVHHKTPYVDAYRDNFPSSPNTEFVMEPALDMLKNHVVNQEVVVPPGRYFVMGDNRDLSLDSRYFGFVPGENIKARPVLVYFSSDGETGDIRWARILKRIG